MSLSSFKKGLAALAFTTFSSVGFAQETKDSHLPPTLIEEFESGNTLDLEQLKELTERQKEVEQAILLCIVNPTQCPINGLGIK